VLFRKDLDQAEIRVLGSLLEKERATPDAYPLSLNSLRLACNQATNRDPVVAYEEPDVLAALGRLGRRHWIRSSHPDGSRTAKYRHLIADQLDLAGDELALLAVLMLRGAQTPGELKQRSARLHRFEDLDDLHLTLEGLIERELVRRLPRRPGQKEERYEQLFGDAAEEAAGAADGNGDGGAATQGGEAAPKDDADGRLEALEAAVEELRRRLDRLEAGAEQLATE